MLSYEELISEIEQCGGTHAPALFMAVVESTVRKACFVPGGVERTARSIEQRILKEIGGGGQNVPQHAQPKIITLHCGKCTSRFTLTENSIHRRCGLDGCDGVLHKIS